MKSIKVCGARVLVKPLRLEEADDVYKKIKAAGLEVPDSDEVKREKAALDKGRVVSVGPLAWYDWKDGEPWAKEGDLIMWARHAGRVVEKNGDDVLVIINDDDVLCVLEDK
jgi:co-chaperonin GroES (HSP10)